MCFRFMREEIQWKTLPFSLLIFKVMKKRLHVWEKMRKRGGKNKGSLQVTSRRENIDFISYYLPSRPLTAHLINIGMIISSITMAWMLLVCISGNESPAVCVLSGSMEPGIKRGDMLFLHMNEAPIRAGEIVVYLIEGREIPIFHRVVTVHEELDTGKVNVLTKGDSNRVDDRRAGIYLHGQLWLQRQHIIARAIWYIQYAGWAKIIMAEKPIIQYLLLGALGLLAMTPKE